MKCQTRETGDEADIPRGGALILGNSRGKSPETPGSPRPPEGAVEAEGGVREELSRQDQEEPAYWRKRRMKREGQAQGEEAKGCEGGEKEKPRRKKGER